MRDPSPGTGSPRGSSSSLTNGSVMKNAGFMAANSNEHLPWNNSHAMSLPKNCHLNLQSETQSPLIRTSSNASALTSLSVDLSPSDSHFFEVLYIGKVRISQRKVPDSLIDDALVKFVQHDAEKARAHRRHSLLSSTGTSIYSNDSTEKVSEEKQNEFAIEKKKLLTNTSTTPLEPDKGLAWKSEDNIEKQLKTDTSQVDDEFDSFTKERIEKNNTNVKKHIPLEPNVMIINKNNLGTVEETEEKPDEITTMISDAASSITQFCQTSFLKERGAQKDDSKEEKANKDEDNVSSKDKDKIDPLLNVQLEITEENLKEIPVKVLKKEKSREDSPTPINFDEISRKPKSLLRKTGLNSNDTQKSAMPENKSFLRDRSASIGNLNQKTPIAQLIGEQNRTMLFQVGRSELRLISPDRKQILLHRSFKDVASCVLGRNNKEHFGFVCRETVNDSYACYVFKCESDSIAQEIVNAIRQAFVAHAELVKKSREKSPIMTCEHCPMLWYHRLCHDIEGMNDKRTHAFVLRRIENLPEDEQDQIITKYQGGTNHMYETCEHNAFLMMLLRAHCEAKQHRHVHDTAENRSEFLNQYLGGSTIFMKAKRSLSSGFDHLLKRRSSKDDINAAPHLKKELSPLPTLVMETSSEPSVTGAHLSPDMSRSKSLSPAINEPPPSPTAPCPNPLPSTVEEEEEDEEEEEEGEFLMKPPPPSTSSPMMDIFLKVSDARPAPREGGSPPDGGSTWRQAIYQKVVRPSELQGEGDIIAKNLLNLKENNIQGGRKTKEQLRELWKMAIDQTILLVRMERENAKLIESEESSAVRRIKLEYTELGVCDAGVSLMWDSMLASRDTSNRVSKVDHHMLTQAVIQGVPRMSRGGVWYFLAEQACLRSPPPDAKRYPNYNIPYKTLLSGLTKHQHAILIDLGRTFPQHSYFASALGPGQLALYNILKAYSLVDPEVGYCQGLSFVAGVLLLHMEEGEAFILLRHLMFRRGLRKQYLPDMSALQVQFYQQSRLLRDHEPELHEKLESLDISPALYAAPWMLTLFTSQFPLGFVVRVFDLIFLESIEVVFSVSLALLSVHKDGIMMCESCEEAAEYLKHKLPDMGRTMYEKVMKKVHSLDISRQLTEYAVEYTVLREEMPRVSNLVEMNKKLTADNRRMEGELDSAMESLTNYQTSQTKLESQLKQIDQQITLLSRYITAHHRQDLPLEIKKIVQSHCKKLSFGSKIFSTKFSNQNADEDDARKNLRTGTSTPNLFGKISKEDVLNAVNRDKKLSENDRRNFMMKKSQSVNSGLIATNLKHFPLKVLNENAKDRENEDKSKNNIIENVKDAKDGPKPKGFFANTHELIRQERLFEKQLKQDFDENLKKFDEKLSPKSYMDDISMFQSRKSMSLNIIGNKVDKSDSGFASPLSPDEKRDDSHSVISHPLSDCDVEIKFDGQSTKLKQIRPLKHT